MERPTIIAPSILACDFARMGDECEAVLEAGADWLHFDVMDGHFVPNISIGFPVLRSLRAALPEATIDVHLMIENPDDYVEAFAEAGADLITFHPEATYHPHRVLQKIHACGIRGGLVFNPATPLDWVEHLVDDLDIILLMSVNPGFGGQAFIESTLPKLRELRGVLGRLGRDLDVEVDGGVTPDNVAAIHAAGANVLVAGSAIFGSDSYEETIDAMRTAADQTLI